MYMIMMYVHVFILIILCNVFSHNQNYHHSLSAFFQLPQRSERICRSRPNSNLGMGKYASPFFHIPFCVSGHILFSVAFSFVRNIFDTICLTHLNTYVMGLRSL